MSAVSTWNGSAGPADEPSGDSHDGVTGDQRPKSGVVGAARLLDCELPVMLATSESSL